MLKHKAWILAAELGLVLQDVKVQKGWLRPERLVCSKVLKYKKLLHGAELLLWSKVLKYKRLILRAELLFVLQCVKVQKVGELSPSGFCVPMC